MTIREQESNYSGPFDPAIREPILYALKPLFFGITVGPIYGGVTGAMMNMSGTPDMRLRVLRSTAVFAAMGLAYGAVGLATIWGRLPDEPITEENWARSDDFTARFASGCAAGATLGLSSKSFTSACGACVSLGLLSMAGKYYDGHRQMFNPDPRAQELLKPVLVSDVPSVDPKEMKARLYSA